MIHSISKSVGCTECEEKDAASPIDQSLCPLLLPNALAACMLTCRLAHTHKEWAAQQLV